MSTMITLVLNFYCQIAIRKTIVITCGVCLSCDLISFPVPFKVKLINMFRFEMLMECFDTLKYLSLFRYFVPVVFRHNDISIDRSELKENDGIKVIRIFF